MDPSFVVSTVQAAGGGGVMMWGIFSWHMFGPLVPIEHRLNTTAYMSIVADHVHPFMTTVYSSSDATSSRIMHHVTKLKCDPLCENPAKVDFFCDLLFFTYNHPSQGKEHSVKMLPSYL